MNKKSILSLKKCALSFGLAMMAAGFTACSEKDMPDGPQAPNEDITETTVGSPINVVNDPSELDKYVTNYKMPGSRGSRATKTRPDAPVWSMPNLSIPTDAEEFTEIGDIHNGNKIISAGNTVTAEYGFNINGGALYVAGTLNTKSTTIQNGAKVYVLDGGVINVTGTEDWCALSANSQNSCLYVYNGGTITGNYKSTNGGETYVDQDVDLGETGNLFIGGTFYVNGDVSANYIETNNANFVAKNVAADSWTFYNDSKVYVEGKIDIDKETKINAQNAIDCEELEIGGNFHMENNSTLNAYGNLKVAGNFTNATQGVIYTPCLYVRKQLQLTNCGKLEIPKHIYCNDFLANASGWTINMDGDALIEAAQTFTVENKNWYLNFNNSPATPSAIVTEKFQIMEGDAGYIHGYAFLSAAGYWGKPSENFQYYQTDNYKAYNLDGSVKATMAADKEVVVTSSPTKCTPEFTTPEPEHTYIEILTSISHTHDTSATCIALDANGKPYFSWHKRGTSIHGCLEAGALDKANDTFALTSWMEVNDGDTEGGDNWGGNSAVSGADAEGETQGQFDYNHLIVAEGQVVTVGDNAKMGGFIGAIELMEDGNFGMEGTLQEAFKSRQLLAKVPDKVGRSGNCVLYANNKYYIACAGGFQEFNVTEDVAFNDLFTKEYYKNGNFRQWKANLGDTELTNGSAKHIAINPAGNKIATLELTEKGSHTDGDDYWFNDTETAIGAVLKVRDANNWLNSSEWSAEIGDICPIYGKNAIAMDNSGNVYVAAGRQGLLVYKDGNKVGEFSIAKKYPTAGANGLAIDDKYVYVAYGLGGLWILNKSDLSVYDKYTSNAPDGYESEVAAASANYVAVDGQYIYVAYGRHGVKILKLND